MRQVFASLTWQIVDIQLLREARAFGPYYLDQDSFRTPWCFMRAHRYSKAERAWATCMVENSLVSAVRNVAHVQDSIS